MSCKVLAACTHPKASDAAAAAIGADICQIRVSQGNGDAIADNNTRPISCKLDAPVCITKKPTCTEVVNS